MKEKLKRCLDEWRCLLRETPALLLCVFVTSVFAMNLLANKNMSLPVSWFALDCGTLLSWIAFLCMDILTKHFGPRAATFLSVFSLGMHFLFCGVLFLASIIPGVWSMAADAAYSEMINTALDQTFGGTWYVLLGSGFAFLLSAIVNNFSNSTVLRLFKNKDSLSAFLTAGYVSTALGQFVDNLVFSLAVSHVFFGWSFLQCVMSALGCMLFEMLCQGLFAGAGYRTCQKWRQAGVGKEYFALLEKHKAEKKA
ncbi:MAG: VUT family protein [Clostridia bacterium]|nr:VUT family protein [Clostridia bacterium]